MLEKVGGLSSMMREDHGTKYAALQDCPKDAAAAYGSTASGGRYKRSADPHDAIHTTKKVSSSNNNIFTSISNFFTHLGNNHSQDNTHAVTPVTTAGSALSSSEEAPTEIYDDEPAPLDPQWGSDSEILTLPLAGCEKRTRSPPIAINVAGKRSSWRTEASPNGANGGCHGRRAGDPEDQGRGEGGDGRSQEADAKAKIKAWQELCASKKVSFTGDDEEEKDETFVPSYATFTPTMSSECLQDMKYKAPERRVPSAVAPPSSMVRPNYHDALRRVSVVVYQHIKTCEWKQKVAEKRRKAAAAKAANAGTDFAAPSMKAWRRSAPSLATLRSNESALWGEGGWSAARREGQSAEKKLSPEPFNHRMADIFDEKYFVSPTLRYNFVHAPIMALPGAMFTLREVRSTPKVPTVDEIYGFVKTLFNKACLSSECSLVCLIYVERLMETAHVPLLAGNWKPVLLCGLLLASKVWQDLSSWNVEFSTVYPQYSLKSINRLELLFLGAIRWDMSISSSMYAKYYFALRSLTEKEDFRRRYNRVLQIDAPRATNVEVRADALKKDVSHAQPISMTTSSSASMLSKSL